MHDRNTERLTEGGFGWAAMKYRFETVLWGSITPLESNNQSSNNIVPFGWEHDEVDWYETTTGQLRHWPYAGKAPWAETALLLKLRYCWSFVNAEMGMHDKEEQRPVEGAGCNDCKRCNFQHTHEIRQKQEPTSMIVESYDSRHASLN